MAIEKIILENFTVFSNLDLEFSSGINVFIGENGTGKTHLLKVLYSFCETEHGKKEFVFDFEKNLKKSFNSSTSHAFFNDFRQKIYIEIFEKKSNYNIVILSDERAIIFESMFSNPEKQKNNSVFIPVTEMLSHSNGFLNMYQKFKLPFNLTESNVLVNAGIPETREVSETTKKIMNTISTIIDGEVVFEDDTYYIIKKDNRKVEFSLEAEGFKKFALLWRLLSNGSIDKGSILFWDEPEANINPKLIPLLVDILFELEKNGVQIFLATHDYNLAKYLEVRMKKNNKISFHALYKEGNDIKCETQKKFSFIKNNSIIKESIRLYEEEVTKVMG